MKRKFILIAVLAVLMILIASVALAWDESTSGDYWYINANYGAYYSTPDLVIEIDGDSASGQVFDVGETITITCDVNPYAASCGQYGNGAYTEWYLGVSGPSGPDSVGDYDYDSSDSCAEVNPTTTAWTLQIPYTLTSLGTHTIYASSYAAVSSQYTDIADEYLDAGLAFDVVDTEPPTFDTLSVSPEILWPPNHKYVSVAATVAVSDNFDPSPSVALLSVESNEPDNGLGDGDTADDIVVVDDYNFKLRAERSGLGTGRIYTITYQATDSSGNTTTASVEVMVPLSMGKN